MGGKSYDSYHEVFNEASKDGFYVQLVFSHICALVLPVMLYAGQHVIEVDCSTVVNPQISPYIFGANAASYMSSSVHPQMIKHLDQWCETIRWLSGGNANRYDWYTHCRGADRIYEGRL